jgi:hypothetical protein
MAVQGFLPVFVGSTVNTTVSKGKARHQILLSNVNFCVILAVEARRKYVMATHEERLSALEATISDISHNETMLLDMAVK